MRDPEVLRAVDGGHLEGGNRVEPELDGRAQDAVHMALVHEGVRVVVVGAEQAQARVNAACHELREIAG